MVEPVSFLTNTASELTSTSDVSDIRLESMFSQEMAKPLKPLGEVFFEGIQNIHSDFQQQSRVIEAKVTTESEMNISDLMQVQMDLSRLMLAEETLAKTVSKSTQNIDTLLKSQ